MSDVQFEEPEFNYRQIDISGAIKHNTPYLIKWGFVSNVRQANILMIVLFIIAMGISAFLIFKYNAGDNIKYREDFSKEQLQNMLPDIANKLPSKTK